MGKLSEEDRKILKKLIEKIDEGEKCPNKDYCADFQGDCIYGIVCLMVKEGDPESVFYVWALDQLTSGRSIIYREPNFIFEKKKFINAGGDETRLDAIMDDAMEAYYYKPKSDNNKK